MNKIWLSVKLFQRYAMIFQVADGMAAYEDLVINFWYVLLLLSCSWLLSWLHIVTWSVHSGSYLLNILCVNVPYQTRIEVIWIAPRKPLDQLADIIFFLTRDMRLWPDVKNGIIGWLLVSFAIDYLKLITLKSDSFPSRIINVYCIEVITRCKRD